MIAALPLIAALDAPASIKIAAANVSQGFGNLLLADLFPAGAGTPSSGFLLQRSGQLASGKDSKELSSIATDLGSKATTGASPANSRTTPNPSQFSLGESAWLEEAALPQKTATATRMKTDPPPGEAGRYKPATRNLSLHRFVLDAQAKGVEDPASLSAKARFALSQSAGFDRAGLPVTQTRVTNGSLPTAADRHQPATSAPRNRNAKAEAASTRTLHASNEKEPGLGASALPFLSTPPKSQIPPVLGTLLPAPGGAFGHSDQSSCPLPFDGRSSYEVRSGHYENSTSPLPASVRGRLSAVPSPDKSTRETSLDSKVFTAEMPILALHFPSRSVTSSAGSTAEPPVIPLSAEDQKKIMGTSELDSVPDAVLGGREVRGFTLLPTEADNNKSGTTGERVPFTPDAARNQASGWGNATGRSSSAAAATRIQNNELPTTLDGTTIAHAWADTQDPSASTAIDLRYSASFAPVVHAATSAATDRSVKNIVPSDGRSNSSQGLEGAEPARWTAAASLRSSEETAFAGAPATASARAWHTSAIVAEVHPAMGPGKAQGAPRAPRESADCQPGDGLRQRAAGCEEEPTVPAAVQAWQSKSDWEIASPTAGRFGVSVLEASPQAADDLIPDAFLADASAQPRGVEANLSTRRDTSGMMPRLPLPPALPVQQPSAPATDLASAPEPAPQAACAVGLPSAVGPGEGVHLHRPETSWAALPHSSPVVVAAKPGKQTRPEDSENGREETPPIAGKPARDEAVNQCEAERTAPPAEKNTVPAQNAPQPQTMPATPGELEAAAVVPSTGTASAPGVMPAPQPGPVAGRDSHMPGDPTSSPRPADPASLPQPVVPSAHVLERMGHEEMRVKISTAEFGNVELRANVVEDRVGATISATHPELHAAMMAEMPRLERAIEQHQLHLDRLDLHARGEDGEREGRDHQHTRPQPSLLSNSSRERPEAPEIPATAPWLSVSHDGGLSVHA